MVFGLSPGATTSIGLLMVLGFCVWKFIIQPRENEGKPIDPPEEELEESQVDY